jgi:hypothetical protein
MNYKAFRPIRMKLGSHDFLKILWTNFSFFYILPSESRALTYVHFFLYFPHLLLNLDENRYERSTRTASEYASFLKIERGTEYVSYRRL